MTTIKDDPKKPYKAYVATAATFIFTFLAFWVADTDPFTLKEAGQGLLMSGMASGLTGVGTYSVKNPKK